VASSLCGRRRTAPVLAENVRPHPRHAKLRLNRSLAEEQRGKDRDITLSTCFPRLPWPVQGRFRRLSSRL